MVDPVKLAETSDEEKPVLVFICGAGLDKPKYSDLLKMKEDCRKLGQDVVLIPPPNKAGDGPAWDVRNLSAQKVQAELNKNFINEDAAYKGRETSVFIVNHGIVNDTGFIFEDIEKETVGILSAIINLPKNLGCVNGSCHSAASFPIIQDLLASSSLKEGEFYYGTNAPYYEGAWQEDGLAFVKEIPKYVQKGVALTPKNLTRIYLKVLADTHEFRGINVYERIFDLSKKSEFKNKIPYESLEEKLENLLSNKEKLKLSEAQKKELQPFFNEGELNKLLNIVKSSKDLKDFVSKVNDKDKPQLYGDALLLADVIFPENNDYITKKHVELYGLESYQKFSEIFVSLDKKEQVKVIGSIPDKFFDRFNSIYSALENKDGSMTPENLKKANELLIIGAEKAAEKSAHLLLNYSEDWLPAFKDENGNITPENIKKINKLFSTAGIEVSKGEWVRIFSNHNKINRKNLKICIDLIKDGLKNDDTEMFYDNFNNFSFMTSSKRKSKKIFREVITKNPNINEENKKSFGNLRKEKEIKFSSINPDNRASSLKSLFGNADPSISTQTSSEIASLNESSIALNNWQQRKGIDK
ncbi:MAG: hypothetical protein ACTSXQ_00740 [Alphaproteobacteria bacterium]